MSGPTKFEKNKPGLSFRLYRIYSERSKLSNQNWEIKKNDASQFFFFFFMYQQEKSNYKKQFKDTTFKRNMRNRVKH